MLTGSKNALKGAGFFLGGFLLATLGFGPALWAMAGCLGVALAATMVLLPGDLGRAKAKTKFTQLFSKSRAINRLSAARVFLFGARDVWFVVGLPVFLYDVLGWRFAEIGAFLALWVIGYGFVQGLAPSMTMCSADGRSSEVRGAQIWVLGLTAVTLVLAAAMQSSVAPTTLLIVGLGVFGFVFAVNSVLHSYLILAFSNSSDVSLNVGFYYMANAAGRLGGTLLSGLAYQWGGLVGCLVTAAALLAAAAVFTLMLGPVVHERTATAE
jgi:predicted MFS family arabinose efflux permease